MNYGALDVEEFGSVYEGLLEFDAIVAPPTHAMPWRYTLAAGKARAASGSHYTPEALVQPLLQHSLDLLIQEKLREAAEGVRPATKGRAIPTEAESKAIQIAQTDALLSLRIADVACGSGHMLLSAARRLATELARIQTGQEQPSPNARRAAQRQVISQCLYGTDYNPLAVELCKVALWLEAHNPGEPLDFLDHHIRCGNAIVGLTRPEDLSRGIATEAFASLKGDDKPFASALRSRNRQERTVANQTTFEFEPASRTDVRNLGVAYEHLRQMPDHTAEEVEAKGVAYRALREQASTFRLGQLADLQVAPFFIPKTANNAHLLLTDADYRRYLRGTQELHTAATDLATEVSIERRFFHWFIEFPDVLVEHGGFDLILGNPPFLGNRGLKGAYGDAFLNWVTTEYAPAGAVDLVTYFFRRIFRLLRPGGILSLISTNTIAQGDAREGGLAVLLDEGGRIHHAVRSMKWPGRANVEVSLITLQRAPLNSWPALLDGKTVPQITSYLDDDENGIDPYLLKSNANQCFQGSIVLGTGFILAPETARHLIDTNPENSAVIYPYLNGDDLNSSSDQSPSRWVINFHDWPLRRFSSAEWEELTTEERERIELRISKGNVVATAPPDYNGKVAEDYPECLSIVEKLVRPERQRLNENGEYVLRSPLPELWWIYADKRPKLYRAIQDLEHCLVTAHTSKLGSLDFASTKNVLDAKLIVFRFSDYGIFGLMQSNFHLSWAWKYRTSMRADLIYANNRIFETFPFPELTPKMHEAGLTYYTFRQQLMQDLNLGLTKTYNLFHTPDLTATAIAKAAKLNDRILAEDLCTRFRELRSLHCQMDKEVAYAYGWPDIDLDHGFHAQEYLPENDRIRFTISPAARREILEGLLALNHLRYAEEQAVLANQS
ncbi:hypothetical protein H9L05_15725 [Hymenobacter qilianensis]|uniref:site-specific DNA-methyltransferase (adenine-specific) n=1 Tax=Hymenobacter qilianensis TaxID=1385715 RepID=A0A7H0GT43_9BACT|nr:DNA methyltransferase [Hymenobacter qilianensis]QNP51459.1 hypothetical protein H9L05_15725 [Hymenobacter qilianensis]